MQASCNQLHGPPGTAHDEGAAASPCGHSSRSTEGSLHPGDVHIQINSGPKEYSENPSSRNTRSGVCTCAHGCVHSRLRSYTHSEARPPDDYATESGEHESGSFSEFHYLFKWLQKSLPYILILGVKLVMQHITGTVIKALVCLVTGVPGRFFHPLILHLSFSVTSLQGYWYMLLEELCQYYRIFVPIPVWFRYLISYGEFGNVTTWSLGILLALLYLILKLLDFFGHLRTFRQVLRVFFTRPSYGVPASKRQCSDMDGICSICQAEFQKPVLLFCQHIFCEECITLWFNREKTCPLCRTVISERINKWKDGATSSHLQMY
ncbi:E3 ubiquitin-protein ligase RNFT1 isoform X2 [Grammomys surdaster]|uniref:E3 ubiquitin-protein ligase RNFT1 isoform X2 n=1 Tax=Grammomys surdaster TaxID=491861 RepID=UPI0010A0A9D3|nr:E3 ubiquitin-protein ligase RNFT1 isoform X2 [Grammomys surdaster]